MQTWLRAFYRRFPDATQEHTGKRQDLDKVERAVRIFRSSRSVNSETLRILEEHDGWDYPRYWLRLSGTLRETIALPQDIRRSEARREAIEALYRRLHHIEVVSVVLRFVFPDWFGIISPRTVSLLNLTYVKDAPTRQGNVSFYERYLESLLRLQRQHGLARVADVDMGLWSAAHLREGAAELTRLMYQDEHFQALRLRNLLEGLSDVLKHTDRLRLLFARSMLQHDSYLAALIAAPVYESLLLDVATRWGVRCRPRQGQSKAGAIADQLSRCPYFTRLGFSRSDPKLWWKRRCAAVHPEDSKPITAREATLFVKAVRRFYEKLGGPRSRRRG